MRDLNIEDRGIAQIVCGKLNGGSYILATKARIRSDNVVRAGAGGNQFQDELNANTGVPYDRLSAQNCRISDDTRFQTVQFNLASQPLYAARVKSLAAGA
jgi:hypothetical protein